MNLVTFRDARLGDIRLQATLVELRLAGSIELSEWEYETEVGRDVLLAITSPFGFPWPRRLDTLQLFDCQIEVGCLTHPLFLDKLVPDMTVERWIEETWPESMRQSEIPSIVPFRIVQTGPSPRLKGRYLHEIF